MFNFQNMSIQENTQGHDGSEYALHFTLTGVKGSKVESYIQPFLFYNGKPSNQHSKYTGAFPITPKIAPVNIITGATFSCDCEKIALMIYTQLKKKVDTYSTSIISYTNTIHGECHISYEREILPL